MFVFRLVPLLPVHEAAKAMILAVVLAYELGEWANSITSMVRGTAVLNALRIFVVLLKLTLEAKGRSWLLSLPLSVLVASLASLVAWDAATLSSSSRVASISTVSTWTAISTYTRPALAVLRTVRSFPMVTLSRVAAMALYILTLIRSRSYLIVSTFV